MRCDNDAYRAVALVELLGDDQPHGDAADRALSVDDSRVVVRCDRHRRRAVGVRRVLGVWRRIPWTRRSAWHDVDDFDDHCHVGDGDDDIDDTVSDDHVEHADRFDDDDGSAAVGDGAIRVGNRLERRRLSCERFGPVPTLLADVTS